MIVFASLQNYSHNVENKQLHVGARITLYTWQTAEGRRDNKLNKFRAFHSTCPDACAPGCGVIHKGPIHRIQLYLLVVAICDSFLVTAMSRHITSCQGDVKKMWFN